MGHLTDNRPKCLLSLGGRPILYSAIDAFGSNLDTIIISDYKSDVLSSYLESFPPSTNYNFVKTKETGTLAGVREAIELTNGEGFALIWSDLLFVDKVKTDDIVDNSIGVSNKIRCRWSYIDNKLLEIPNISEKDYGITGIFFFPNPEFNYSLPVRGEFVKFLSDSNVHLTPIVIDGVKEIGTYELYRKERDNQINSRFFNQVSFINGKVIKETKDKNFENLILDEINWYKFVSSYGFDAIPKVYSLKPLTLELINGDQPYNLGSKSNSSKVEIIQNILSKLERLHSLGKVAFNKEVAEEVYVTKTIDRIKRVSNLIPNNASQFYVVNGLKVPNLLLTENQSYIYELFEKLLAKGNSFNVIHGDPTFSNIIIRGSDDNPLFIDPRGYFGSIKIYGDPLYDYAKLYYSVVGNYDFFNQGRFKLKVDGNEIKLKIQSENFESQGQLIEQRAGNKTPAIRALHSLIWLSLAGYVIDDYDAILSSYFKGLELFTEVYNEYS